MTKAHVTNVTFAPQ